MGEAGLCREELNCNTMAPKTLASGINIQRCFRLRQGCQDSTQTNPSMFDVPEKECNSGLDSTLTVRAIPRHFSVVTSQQPALPAAGGISE